MRALGDVLLMRPFRGWLQLLALLTWLGGGAAMTSAIMGDDRYFLPWVVWTLTGFGCFVATLRGTRVRVFEDGLRIGSRFVAFREVERLERARENLARLVLAEGARIEVAPRLGIGPVPSSSAVAAAFDELDRRIARARAAPVARLASELARREEPEATWLGRALGVLSPGGFRDGVVGRADVLDVAEDPAAEPTARAAAVLALLPGLTDEERRRVRVAAATTATPRVRVVLEAAADEAASEAELARLVAKVGG